jgi:MarR family transcriptional regulator, organic hydroperoxide resistance regulator
MRTRAARLDVPARDFRDTLPFAVHRLAARAVAIATDDFAALGLTVSEARVVLVTLQHGPLRVSLIAEYTALELSTLSHMLGRLEKARILTRKRIANDARSVEVTLTARGRRLAQRAEKQMMIHQEQMLDGFTAAEIATFRRLIAQTYERIAAIAPRRTATLKTVKRAN